MVLSFCKNKDDGSDVLVSLKAVEDTHEAIN